MQGATGSPVSPHYPKMPDADRSEGQKKAKGIQDVPPELLPVIFANLSVAQIARAGEVCKSWNNASKDTQLSAHVVSHCLNNEENYQNINDLVLKLICQRKCPEDDLLLNQLLERSENLRAAQPDKTPRAVDEVIAGLTTLLVHAYPNISYLPHIGLAGKMPCIISAAESDNLLAQFILALPQCFVSLEPLAQVANEGYIYAELVLNQVGGEHDDDEANDDVNTKNLFETLKRLSDQGHMGAKVQLLGWLEDEDSIPDGDKLAASLVRELAESGRPYYQVKLAQSLVKENKAEEAIFWLDSAAKSGNLHAKFLLGTLYNKENANRYSLELASQGEGEVPFYLGCQQKAGLNTAAREEIQRYLQSINELSLLGIPEMQIPEDICEQLGKMYASGEVLTRDLNKSAEYKAIAQKAYEASAKAQKELAALGITFESESEIDSSGSDEEGSLQESDDSESEIDSFGVEEGTGSLSDDGLSDSDDSQFGD